MFKSTILHSGTKITIEVTKNLEGFKVQSTIDTGTRTMKTVSPETWAHEARANREAQGWVAYQIR